MRILLLLVVLLVGCTPPVEDKSVDPKYQFQGYDNYTYRHPDKVQPKYLNKENGNVIY